MIVFQTLLVLYLWIWALPTHTFAHPCRIESDPDANSALLLCSGDNPSPSSAVDLASTTSIPSLVVREWPPYPTYKPPSQKRDRRPGIPKVVAILFPVIIASVILCSIFLYASRKGERGTETTGQVWGDSATVRMDNVNNQTRQGYSQPPPPFQQLRDLEISVVDEAPPPYSREPPK